MKLRNLSDEFQQSNSKIFLSHLGLIIVNGVTEVYFIITFLSGQTKRNEAVSVVLIITALIFVNIYMEVAQQIQLKVIIFSIWFQATTG